MPFLEQVRALGPKVVVEPGAHVENSILLEGTHVEREATVVGSLLGPGVRVRSGHRIAAQVLGEGVEA